MKTNFKHAIIAATALLLGFGSCSNDDANAPEADDLPEKKVTVSISVPSTYADEATAVGLTPDIFDAKLFFIGAGVIKNVEDFTGLVGQATATETFTVSGSVTEVVIVANAAAILTDAVIGSIAPNDPVAELDALLFVQANQTHPKTGVNVFGRNTISGTPGNLTVSITLTPAISRYEIAKVEAKTSPTPTIALTSFELAGIYINNTYEKLGTDYITATTAVNYGSTATAWTDGSYPSKFNDEPGLTGSLVYTPTPTTNRWSYYVLPVKAAGGQGTLINGERFNVIPHIILKIKDAKAVGHTFPEYTYVTIRELKDGVNPITELLPGKVYSIATIAIDGANLTELPETNPTEDIEVTATVTPWSNLPVTPTL